MIKRSHFTSITVVLITFFVLVKSATADLLVNGDFSSDLSVGWAVSNGQVELWNFPLPAGSSIDVPAALFISDLDDEDFEHSTLYQIFDLEEESLTLSFDVLMETGGGDTDVFTASLNGTTIYTLSSDFGGTSYEETFTYDVSALAGQEVELVFDLFHDYTDYSVTSVILDNVAVEVVPIPSAVILGSLGLTFSGWLLKRREI